MSNAITRKPGKQVAQPSRPSPRQTPPGALAWTRKYIVEPVASLRFTVVLFAMSFFLVFVSTLALIDAGLWTVVERYFRTWGLAWIPYQAFVRLGQVFFFVPKDVEIPGYFPFPGGWFLGSLLMINLLTAHALRFRFTWKDIILLPAFVLGAVLLWIWQDNPSLMLVVCGTSALLLSIAGLLVFHGKRGGVILLHLGLVVLMTSELVTGLFAVERTMMLAEGETVNFLEASRKTELAIIDRSNPKQDDVVAIPQSILRKGGVISDPLLPFDVVVDRYMPNAVLEEIQPGEDNPATAGDGLFVVAHERPEVTGTDPEQRKDIPAAYVTLKKKGNGQRLATVLVSVQFNTNSINRMSPDRPQRFGVSGKNYELFLRPERAYTPYHIELLEFRHDKYLGTEVPKNFSSKVRLTDPARHEDRVVRISMNQPLRYAGETLYQYQAPALPRGKGSVLQVVRNPGWLIPYISCVLVALGLMIHFGLHLAAFLRRRAVS
jgi:hypothetical protein